MTVLPILLPPRPASPDPAAMDVLSDVLRCVRLTGSMFFLVNASMPWITKAPAASVFASAVLPAAQHLISYHVITEGHCWAGLEGEVPQRLEAGDILVVPHGDPYMLSASPETRAELADEEALRFFRSMAAGELPSVVVEGGGGPETTNFICGFLGCDARPFNPILAALPRVLYLRGATERGGRMSHLVEFALCELRERRSGSREVLLRLSELMFIETVRCHLASALEAEAGWFVGLRDPMVARVLARLHAEPERGWTLDALADDVAASRSVLAERFTRLVGQPPMHYLKAWRMQLAARMLMDRSAKVRTVAEAVGYQSEAAFSRAFKRLAGSAPTQYRESFPEKGFVRFA